MFVRSWALLGAFVRSRSAMGITLAAAIIGASTVGLAGAVTSGLIHACVNNSSGTIKIVEATTTCSGNEIQLVWNAEGSAGPAGPAGPTGPTGATGPQGSAGLSGYEVVPVVQILGPLSAGEFVTGQATCPAGKKVLGGGANLTSPVGNLWISAPSLNGTQWVAAFRIDISVTAGVHFVTWATCAHVEP